MNGIEFSKQFFHDWGVPYLNEHYQGLADRVAVGIFACSQAIGADDKLSKDHGWGPMFTMILTNEDYARVGEKLSTAINKAAPKEWNGIKYRPLPANTIRVYSVDSFFAENANLGLTEPPKTPQAWIGGNYRYREGMLYMLRHATVYHDPLGEFSTKRNEFHFYPDLFWWKRIHDELWDVWHFGQYNYQYRLKRRDYPIADAIAVGKFCDATMRLCLLLEKDYTPYWKWLSFAFRKSGHAQTLEPMLVEMSVDFDKELRTEKIKAVCAYLGDELIKAGFNHNGERWGGHLLFFIAEALNEKTEKEWTKDGITLWEPK